MVTGMSFGALSLHAKTALSQGARMAGTSTTTGDGGMLELEREESRVLIYEVLPSRYGIDVRHLRQADAIELTIGQGAKPGTGGLLLGSKVSEEIARLRDLPPGRRPALALPAPRLPRPRRPGDQDRGAARGDRLSRADLRQDGGLARLRRRPPGRQGRGRRGRRRRHGGGHGGLARTAPGAHRHPDPGRRLRGPRRARGHRPVRQGPARHRRRPAARLRLRQGPGPGRRRLLPRHGAPDRARTATSRSTSRITTRSAPSRMPATTATPADARSASRRRIRSCRRGWRSTRPRSASPTSSTRWRPRSRSWPAPAARATSTTSSPRTCVPCRSRRR